MQAVINTDRESGDDNHANTESLLEVSLDCSHLISQSPPRFSNMEKEIFLFYSLLQHKYMVASSTVNAVVHHAHNLLMKSSENLLDHMSSTLKRFDVNETIVANVMQEMQSKSLPLHSYFECTLRSKYSRQLYLQSHFSYIPPITMNLQTKEDSTELFSYQ